MKKHEIKNYGKIPNGLRAVFSRTILVHHPKDCRGVAAKVRNAGCACSMKTGCRMSLMGRPLRRPIGLDFDGFCDGQSIFKSNPEISNGAVHLCVTEKELNSPKVSGLLVDLSDLGSSHRVRSVSACL